MKLLVIGGGVFLGSAFVSAALARGHQVTVFQRGRSSSVPPAGVERILGDRKTDLARAAGDWDAIIDTCAYLPADVRGAIEALRPSCPYLLVSTISAFAALPDPGMTESAALHNQDMSGVEAVTGETYGPLKAACERELLALAAHPIIVRPGLIVGEHDPSGRFSYWADRIARGGAVLAPVAPELPAQCIDVHDLAAFMLTLVEQGARGDFNASGSSDLTLGEVLDTARSVSDSEARVTWVSEAFLEQQGVGAWVELPLWIPSADASLAGMLRVDCSKARAHGLHCRTIAETLRSTLAWVKTPAGQASLARQLKPEREQALLAAWHDARQTSG
ncbi:MAG: epimerase [Burkholderiaceae bacterium]|nr:epimerase [Burkholderiaceae bacterium]